MTAESQQHLAAISRTHYIPLYSFEGEDETELFFVSKVTNPLLIDIFATAFSGEQVYVGRETLPPSRNLSLNLRQRLTAAGEQFAVGSLRFDFVGDEGALQVWAAVRSGRQTFEVPFIPSDKLAVNELLSFWDTSMTGSKGNAQVEYLITNTTTAPVTYTLRVGRGSPVTRTESATIGPLQTRAHLLSRAETTHRGWLHLSHTGPAGAIMGAGLIHSRQKLAYLPLVTPAALSKGPVFEVLRFPSNAPGFAAFLVLFNTGDNEQNVSIDWIASATGSVLATKQVSVDPWEVSTVNIGKLFAAASNPETRLRVRSSLPSLMVDGAVVTTDGEVLDLSIHSRTTAHRSGTYPVPDLDRYEVRTTIINLGPEESQIVAQYFWDGGTFAVPLFVVPAGGSAVIDPSRIASAKVSDLLGRTLDANGRHGALKWSVRRGSHELIGRTEVTPRDGSDSFGFNCGGCCWSIPRGEVVPGGVEIGEGEAPDFTAAAYFDTCSGTVGPYPAGMTYYAPYPFSWNGFQVSASDAAEDDLSFEGVEEATTYLCIIEHQTIAGGGRADSCKRKLEKPNTNPKEYWDPAGQCSAQTDLCTKCLSCCQAIYEWMICKRMNMQFALTAKNNCIGQCEADLSDTCP